MSTMSTDNSDDNTKLAIGELLREADPISKLVIGSYNHVSHHAVNVKSLASAKFKTEQLETCANFLGLKTRDESNQLIFTNKPTLADRIITKIESFFPSKCQDCGEGYRVKYSELQSSPRLQCFLCLQPSHDCDKVKAYIESLEESSTGISSKLIGNAWICSGCFGKNNPLLSNNPRKRSGSVTFDTITPSPSPALSRIGASQSPAPNIIPDETAQDSPAPSNHTIETVRCASESEEQTIRTICQQYKNNRCPHGMNGNKVVNGVTCPHAHPRRCQNYSKFGTKARTGCQQGENCSFFHPNLCNTSVRTLTCLNKNCTFVHLRSTKRHRDRGEPETGQANRPRQRENNGRSQERPPPSVHFQGNGQRPLPQRTRSTSSASQQNRTTTPSLGGYTNSSSEVSFLVRMIQDMKSDFQKDLNHLRESMLPQQTRWNPQALQPSHHQPAPPTQQGVHIQPQHHMLNQPLWNHPTPLFSS